MVRDRIQLVAHLASAQQPILTILTLLVLIIDIENSHAEATLEDQRLELEAAIDNLKTELAVAASVEAVRTKVLDSAHAYQVVLRSLFSRNEKDVDKKELAKTVYERDELVSQYLLIHRDLQKTRLELASAQKDVLDCQGENRALVQRLSEETAALKEAAESQQSSSHRKMAHRTEEELKSVTVKYNIASNVLQGLILESGVDWASDPHLLDVMLKLDGLPE
ncbi:hypothetical protein DFQ27_008825 [Actinomortierella ambigua]|uniref:Centromere protein H C-terminal domain-containing protein n=1 Tax=Actinomortierella ambigua TaxID=1343610 RepID=A0A9P6PQI7_9FUNG|nr:hypothetical protein DFQ27_008825 [Actinomortierella ambigua]